MPTIQDQAICVRHWDWSETSQTVSLLTREHGLIRCLAKGSKREKSAFSGGLEIATLGEMNAILKANSDLALLTSWDLVDPMYLMRTSLSRYHACMFAIDLIPRLINDQDPHELVFDALKTTLGALCDPGFEVVGVGYHAQLAWYSWQLIVQIGAQPELMIDVVTGELLDEDQQVFGFSSTHGGFIRDPKQSEQNRYDDRLSDVWRVRKSTVDILRRFREGAQVEEFAQDSPVQVERAGGLLASYIRGIIGSEVPSFGLIYPSIA